MRTHPLCPILTLCLAMSMAGPGAGFAQQVQPLDPEWLQKMYAEGWHKIEEGVLQRDSGEGEPETFSYGAEGLQWVLRGHQQRLDVLEEKFNQAPTKRLMEMMEQLEGEISRLNKVLAEAPSVDRFDSETMTACVPSFGGAAQAAPPEGTWGVEASASAWFHNDCGQLGDTFAIAYAHAIEGTVETTTTQSEPKNGGSWLDSKAVASISGSADCESSAQATVTSSDLSIVYQTPFVQNFICGVYNTSIYTLDSTTWAQTGLGNIGPLTPSGTGYTLIDSNYTPIATSGLPQAGISITPGGATLTSQAVDTTASFVNASVIRLELAGRMTVVPPANVALAGVSHLVGSPITGAYYGLRISSDPTGRLVVFTAMGSTVDSHHAPEALTLNDTTVETYRWVWTENSAGSSTGTSQWWRKMAGSWQPWGTSKTDMRRPVGHANTRMRIHAHESGVISNVGFDYLYVSLAIGTR